jgi:hypothetical protein
MGSLTDFVTGIKQSKYWPWIKWASAVVIVIVSFAFGRFSQVAEKQVEFKEKLVYVDRVVEKVIEIEKKREDKIRIVYRETKPDGTKTEREEERTKTDTDKSSEKVVERVVLVDREVIKKETTVINPRVMFGVLVGYDAAPTFLKIPSAPNLALGIEAKVRVVGPLWIGAFGLNTGVVGGSVSLTF